MNSQALSARDDLIPDELLASLKDAADRRQIANGTAQMAACSHILDRFNPSLKNAPAFLAVLARWCDAGETGAVPVKKLLATYDPDTRSGLSVSDYVRLRMAEGMVAMKEETLDRAIEDFEIVLKLADEQKAADVLALSNYWIGRCLRKKGNYEHALKHVRKGREIQLANGHLHCAATMRVAEGLILVEKGDLKEALDHLRAAEAVLIQTDDYITLGNIQSTYGRILQREGRYSQAIEHYSRAIENFQKRDLKHPNVARAEVDVSFTRIQVLRHIRSNIDIYADHQQKNANRPSARAVLVKELNNLYEAVLADLDRAALIYERYPNVRGLARVHLYRGSLHHAVGELDLAMQEATKAYLAADSKRDIILMASARNLQCMVEEATVEEEIEGWADHALAARDYAREAVELASQTQERRLLARVHIWYGLTLSNAFFNAHDRAREQMEAAESYLGPTVPDDIWEDFNLLKKRLLQNDTLDTKLTQWARGEIRGKTFRQLEEDFADLVIPIVWRQEGRKVSRVAARFSISPRKVRRVLARLGFLDTSAANEEDKLESNEGLDASSGKEQPSGERQPSRLRITPGRGTSNVPPKRYLH